MEARQTDCVTIVTIRTKLATVLCVSKNKKDMGIFSFLFENSKTKEKVKLLLDKGALIIDVRTPDEYRGGHIKESVNIPLNLIPKKANELKRKNKPIVVCCRSGARSGMAANQLRQAGIEVENGGPWNSVQAMM